MNHNNGDYFLGGMHAGWWILILVLIIVFVGGFSRYRKGK